MQQNAAPTLGRPSIGSCSLGSARPILTVRFVSTFSRRVVYLPAQDLQGYVEFKRYIRAAVKVHHDALLRQREFWREMMKKRVAVRDIQKSFAEMDVATERARGVYRR